MKPIWTAALVASVACAPGAGTGTAPPPSPDATRPARVEMLAESRLRSLARNPNEWMDYLTRSRAQRRADSTSMAAELAAVGQMKVTQAPYARSFEITDRMTPEWFASDSARVITDNLLSFQAPNGGWSKHVNYRAGPRAKGQSYFGESTSWQWISTFDNSSTTEQMLFLVARDSVSPDPRYKEAYRRGLRYILSSQFPNGCWPQVWPLEGGYHDAATFNDDVVTKILTILEDAVNDRPAFLTAAEKDQARAAVDRALDCVIAAQVVVDGKPTAWGQQHDPLTLQPVAARSYELVSLTAQESANLMRVLIKHRPQSPRLANAIHAAAAWLKATQIYGYTYDFQAGRKDAPGEGPLWARMYEIGTNRPIFSDRNGIKLYDWNLLKDRRTGYAWYTYAPVLALRQYENWARRNPAPVTSGSE
jgi:PelA/Pel-15E family pectate lyase